MTRLICESCGKGYAFCETETHCPWCQTSSNLAYVSNRVAIVDTELVIDYWLCKFDTGEVFQMFDGYPLDIDGLRTALSKYTIVTFNGNNYDIPIIMLALSGVDNVELKRASDAIIVDGARAWDVYNGDTSWMDHIDMIEVAPGQASLKMYMAKMHSRKLQDLPFDPDARFKWYDRAMARWYCDNDLRGTRELYDKFQAQLQLREHMSAEYDIDLRSKSDAQIAEAVMKAITPFKIERPFIAGGTQFFYTPPEWMCGMNLPIFGKILSEVRGLPFYVNCDGGVSPSYNNHLVDWSDKAVRLDVHGSWVPRPKDWQHKLVTIGGMSYAMGIGGLHSTESKVLHRADVDTEIISPDVAAYYPSILVRLGLYPKQIGTSFIATYTDWKTRRDAAKIAKDKKTANSLKTLNNGTFGKLGSKWSIFYSPDMMINITITGQLALLMLIEMFEISGVSVISANTDGIVVKIRRDDRWLYDSIIKWWEDVTGFIMENTFFNTLACRDVNSYIGITTDGDVKLKGAFAPPDPGASGWPNPTGQICVDAAVAYIRDGVSLADTIRECDDIRQFVYVRDVRGGGSYAPNGVLPKAATLIAMRKALGDAGQMREMQLPKEGLIAAYQQLRERVMSEVEYLGKTVRWYYAVGSKGNIVTKTGSLVARTQGCVPMMELTDTVPDDLDYEWYIREAESLLVVVGVNAYHHIDR